MSHLLTTRNPQSEARRMHIHGPLRSLADDARAIGEPSLLAGTLVLASSVLALIAAVLFLGSVFHRHAASDASGPASSTISRGVDAVAGRGDSQ